MKKCSHCVFVILILSKYISNTYHMLDTVQTLRDRIMRKLGIASPFMENKDRYIAVIS